MDFGPVWLLTSCSDMGPGISPQETESSPGLAAAVFFSHLWNGVVTKQWEGEAEVELSESSPLAPEENPRQKSLPKPWDGPPRCPADQVCVLQVGLGKNKCLYALEEGVVRYTKEVYVPNPSNSEAVDLVTRLPQGAVLYKTFVHVVPAKPEGTFKLVAML